MSLKDEECSGEFSLGESRIYCELSRGHVGPHRNGVAYWNDIEALEAEDEDAVCRLIDESKPR